MLRRLSVAIQTHPKRAELAAELQARIAGSELAVDPDPDGHPSPWRTYRHALQTTPTWATHRLVIQDDAELCDNFAAALNLVVSARPDRLIVLYVGGNARKAVRALLTACGRDETFAELPPDTWVPAVAVVWPVGLIEPSLRFVDTQRWPVEFRADDEIIGRCMTSIGHRGVMTVPSLVDHPDVVDSIVRVKDRLRRKVYDAGRVAACFIDGDPLEIAWH